ncbi:MAG: hypothetical protein AVDCRST_MAG91-1351 [uncultured Sphingomonadaceae bacterium]|uniref:Uncharacterized protein n=1 Tax=uncultured Sphingomonadaceae bacterium TaxID=169976 RepID=A0A6J4SVA5_9SPHN|nr:MAG: hypothetical protein AVDCRST_MAG91-1351 [uncultured Sphingomonadaceae bacterium]
MTRLTVLIAAGFAMTVGCAPTGPTVPPIAEGGRALPALRID